MIFTKTEYLYHYRLCLSSQTVLLAPQGQRQDASLQSDLNILLFITLERNVSCQNTCLAVRWSYIITFHLLLSPYVAHIRLGLCSSSCEIHNVILEIKWLVTGFQVPEWWTEKLVNGGLKFHKNIEPLPEGVSWAIPIVHIRWKRLALGKIICGYGIKNGHTTCAQGTAVNLKFYMWL